MCGVLIELVLVPVPVFGLERIRTDELKVGILEVCRFCLFSLKNPSRRYVLVVFVVGHVVITIPSDSTLKNEDRILPRNHPGLGHRLRPCCQACLQVCFELDLDLDLVLELGRMPEYTFIYMNSCLCSIPLHCRQVLEQTIGVMG